MIRSAALPSALDAQLREHLLRPDGQEDLCFALWRASTGATRLTHLITEAIWPESGDRRVHGNASFEPKYFLRALDRAASAGAGLALLHSHPRGRGWQDMSQDDIRAEQGHAAQALAVTDYPLLGMTLAGDAAWTARTWTRVGRGEYVRSSCESVRVVGDQLVVTFDPRLRPLPPQSDAFVRTVSSWGEEVQGRVSRLRVAVVGAGSVGAQVAEALLRTGVRHLMLIDFDVVKSHNLDRLAHATRLDAALGRAKVGTLLEALLRLAPHEVDIDARQVSVVEPDGLAAVLDCDVAFSCVDRPWGRQLLDHVAYTHLIPVVDGGIRVRARRGSLQQADWKAHVAAPGRRCMECVGQYSPADVGLERAGDLDDSSYIEGLPEDHYLRASENVFVYSQACASLEMLQFLNMVVGPLGIANPGEWNFHFVTGSLDHERAAACVPNCTHQGSLALGDQAPAPTGVHPVAAAARDAYHSASLRIRIARAVRTGVAHAEARVRGALLRALHHRDLSVSGPVHVENAER